MDLILNARALSEQDLESLRHFIRETVQDMACDSHILKDSPQAQEILKQANQITAEDIQPGKEFNGKYPVVVVAVGGAMIDGSPSEPVAWTVVDKFTFKAWEPKNKATLAEWLNREGWTK